VTFAAQVVAWQRAHGRHDLPWQGTRDPYRIWVSEIMLQQTQVAAVIPYYVRFMLRFPDVATLASAHADDVLAHWSGLGYYSRARNLHDAARTIVTVHGGRFPATFEEVAALAGVGRSTAAAIMVFAYGGRHAILDGNVKRVLARFCGIAGYPGEKPTLDALWREAERLLPQTDIEAYTQGLMDLVSSVCLRKRPKCEACPVAARCVALRERRVDELPAPRPRKAVPHRDTVMLILEHRGRLLLEKRPAPGIWGGLWCFPELAPGEDALAVCAQRYGARISSVEALPRIEHGFTHFTLTIALTRLAVAEIAPRAAEPGQQWLDIAQVREAAIPAPVRRIVEGLTTDLL
jgi:A/G-specific adenine glycosylase